MDTPSAFDAIVVGSGPNGLAAAITLQHAGVQVLLMEAKQTIGGGMRTAELTLPGFYHDVCAAVHPMGSASPFLQSLPLREFGLEFIHPDVAAAHPFDDGTAAALYPSLSKTVGGLGADGRTYEKLFGPLVDSWSRIDTHILGPMLRVPRNPLPLAAFGLKSLLSAKRIASRFQTHRAKGLWAGIAAHSMIPLEASTSAAVAFVLTITGHRHGWPIPKGGSQSIADAMAAYFRSLGGTIQTNAEVKSLDQLPEAKAILFDTSPRQLLEICGDRLSSLYRWQLQRHRYGMGVFKVDWALSDPVPFRSAVARRAGTVHLGGTFGEIARGERQVWNGSHPENPFVLFAQQSVFDPSRAPSGQHTGWAYCHVPHGSSKDMTEAITRQIERFAPGFRDTIRATHTFNTVQMEHYNANYIGGDINGGVVNITQLFNRPALRFSPYRTSAKGVYICSASTPPGGGVHGMCGYFAAKQALTDIF